MKIQEFRKILKAIDECDDSIKSLNVHGFLVSGNICHNVLSRKKASNEIESCVQGAIIQRRHNLIERLKMAGVSIEEQI